MNTEEVTVAILAKNKAHVLPLYLRQIEAQTFPPERIRLYVRTNNNRDDTAALLSQWLERVEGRYAEVHFDASDVPEPVQDYGAHEWTQMRLKVLGRLRQESVEWAKARGTHYFVADCDNFIVPETLQAMLDTGLPVVGPLLRNGDDPANPYSNYHHATDANGYFLNTTQYFDILHGRVTGLIQVNVVHCTYLVRREFLDFVRYDDESGRYEYVIFSETLRKAGVLQYIDNRREYGKLTFCDTKEEFEEKQITI